MPKEAPWHVLHITEKRHVRDSKSHEICPGKFRTNGHPELLTSPFRPQPTLEDLTLLLLSPNPDLSESQDSCDGGGDANAAS